MSMFTKFMDILFGLGEEDISDNEMNILKDVTGFWSDRNALGLEVKKVTKKYINVNVHYVLSSNIRKVKFPRDLNEIELRFCHLSSNLFFFSNNNYKKLFCQKFALLNFKSIFKLNKKDYT